MFDFFAVIAILSALAALFFSFKLLSKTHWILAWCRGCGGLLLVVLSGILFFSALDLFSYKKLLSEKPIAILEFEKKDHQRFICTYKIYGPDSAETKIELTGDQWQMDARIIRWLGMLQALGAKPGYKLDRLTGRYYSLEDERRKERTVHMLVENKLGVDFWEWLQSNKWMPWMEAVYGSATFMPMADGASYQVTLTHAGLAAKPLNDVAQQAVHQWQ